jgi:DNA-binding MarR family transcriptional regulator
MSPKPQNTDEIAQALKRVWHTLSGEGRHEPACQPGSITHQQFWVLGRLTHGPMRMTELAEDLGIATASVTGLIDRLEERGFAERYRDETDRRVVHVAITEEGTRVVSEGKEAFRKRFDVLVAPLTVHEREEFARLLNKIAPRP